MLPKGVAGARELHEPWTQFPVMGMSLRSSEKHFLVGSIKLGRERESTVVFCSCSWPDVNAIGLTQVILAMYRVNRGHWSPVTEGKTEASSVIISVSPEQRKFSCHELSKDDNSKQQQIKCSHAGCASNLCFVVPKGDGHTSWMGARHRWVGNSAILFAAAAVRSWVLWMATMDIWSIKRSPRSPQKYSILMRFWEALKSAPF